MRTAQAIFVTTFFAASHLLALAGAAEEPIPRSEHPRPDLRRDHWQNLNGPWRFCFDPDDRGLGEQWPLGTGPFDRTIVVPFPWQSKLSGINDNSGGPIGWYRRTVRAPDSWRGLRVWLCFGAVHRETRVWIDGQAIGRHEDGDAPFAFDVTDHAPPGKEVCIDVRVSDASNSEPLTSGQDAPEGASGIWQTVWLEARPVVYVDGLRLVSTQSNGRWTLDVEVDLAGADGSAEVALRSPDQTVDAQSVQAILANGHGTARALLKIARPQAWSPEQPHLYDLEVSASGANGQRDVVHSYFGLRTIARGKYATLAHEAILLNGEPLFLRGAIDLSRNVDGLTTAPNDQFLQHDMELARRLGLNLLKIRGKVGEPRRLYWADKLGVLLWQEIPSADCSSELLREAWRETFRSIVRRDRNHPSLIGWTLFHESRGIGGQDFKDAPAMQKWVYDRVREVKDQLDPSRLVEDNASPYLDHINTDVNSWLFHIDDYWVAREHIGQIVSRTRPGSPLGYVPGFVQGTAPLLCGEFIAVGPEGGDVSWPLRFLLTQLRRHALIQGHIVGSFHDVPWRRDGLLHFDRSAKEFGYDSFVPNMTLADLHGADFIGFDAPPVIETAPGEELTLALFTSHYSDRLGPARLRWRIVGTDDYGRPIATNTQAREIPWQRGSVTYQTPLRVRVPEGPTFVGAILAELFDTQDRRVAANYINLIADKGVEMDLDGAPNPACPTLAHVEVLAPRLVALRIPPREFASVRTEPPDANTPDAEQDHYAFGAWQVEYRVALPGFVREAIPSQMVLMAELATRAADGRGPGSPETSDDPSGTHPGAIHVTIWDHELWAASLPDNPADSRGVLSHHARFRDGAYGDLLRRRIDLTNVPQLREAIYQQEWFPLVFHTDGPHSQVSIFGRKLGRYVIDPTLIIQTAKQVERPVGFISHEPVTVEQLLEQPRATEAAPDGEYDQTHPVPIVQEASEVSAAVSVGISAGISVGD